MALILSFRGARKKRVEINYYSYFSPPFADLLCLVGWTQLCKRPNSALIGWEKSETNQKPPCRISVSNKTERGNKLLPPRKTLERTFRMISPELQHLRRYFFLQLKPESRFRSNGVKNSLRMTVVLVIAVSLGIEWMYKMDVLSLDCNGPKGDNGLIVL